MENFKRFVNELIWRIVHFQLRPYVVYAHVYWADDHIYYLNNMGCVDKAPLPKPRMRVIGRYFTQRSARQSFKNDSPFLFEAGRKCVFQALNRISKNGRKFFGDVYI